MSSEPSWRPNVPESQLFDEKTWLQGAILSAVAYGINLTLFTLNVSLLRTRAKLETKQYPNKTTDGMSSDIRLCNFCPQHSDHGIPG